MFSRLISAMPRSIQKPFMAKSNQLRPLRRKN
jgi:hypothetical protein